MAPSPTRAERQAQGDAAPRSEGRGGRRWGLIAAAVIAVVVVAAGAFVLLSGGSDTKSGPTFKASTAVDLQPGETTAAAASPFSGTVPPEVPGQILSVLGTYVEDGIVAPLRKGKADDAALATVFDPAAIAALVGDQRAIVLDEGLPKAVGKVTVTTPPVPLTVLLDKDGKAIAVSAGVQLAVTARVEKGNVQINRTGTFVFAPDAAGGWKITGWTLSTDRGGPGVTPTSTAASVTTTTVAP